MSAQPVGGLDPQDLALAALMHLARTRPLTVADIEHLDPTVVVDRAQRPYECLIFGGLPEWATELF